MDNPGVPGNPETHYDEAVAEDAENTSPSVEVEPRHDTRPDVERVEGVEVEPLHASRTQSGDSLRVTDSLRALMPGVEDEYLDFFELASTHGRLHPVIRPSDVLTEEKRLPSGKMASMTQAASNARFQNENLPHNDVARREAIYQVQRDLRMMFSGWPKAVVNVLLRDPQTDAVDSLGLQMMSARFGLSYKVRPPLDLVAIEINRREHKRELDSFNTTVRGLDGYGSPVEQLDRRMNHAFLVMNPRDPRLSRSLD